MKYTTDNSIYSRSRNTTWCAQEIHKLYYIIIIRLLIEAGSTIHAWTSTTIVGKFAAITVMGQSASVRNENSVVNQLIKDQFTMLQKVSTQWNIPFTKNDVRFLTNKNNHKCTKA